jgi:hypothetical protein
MAAEAVRRGPHGGQVAGERELDGLARQSLGLAREQLGGGECRLVAATGPAAPRVTRPALPERGPAHPPPAVLVTAHQTCSSPWFNRRRIPSVAVH